jgi:hypothetical protein
VPVTSPTTVEDPTITDPAVRERLFGQRDHVRRYGRDFEHRLHEAGFLVTVDEFVLTLPARVLEQLGLMSSDLVYVCRKRTA